jgi:hypothetical protein
MLKQGAREAAGCRRVWICLGATLCTPQGEHGRVGFAGVTRRQFRIGIVILPSRSSAVARRWAFRMGIRLQVLTI